MSVFRLPRIFPKIVHKNFYIESNTGIYNFKFL